MGTTQTGAIPVLLALTRDPILSDQRFLLCSIIVGNTRWFPQLAGRIRLFVFACLRLRDDVVPALADAAHVRGDARSAQRRPKQPFGQIPLDLSTEHGRGHGVQDC